MDKKEKEALREELFTHYTEVWEALADNPKAPPNTFITEQALEIATKQENRTASVEELKFIGIIAWKTHVLNVTRILIRALEQAPPLPPRDDT